MSHFSLLRTRRDSQFSPRRRCPAIPFSGPGKLAVTFVLFIAAVFIYLCFSISSIHNIMRLYTYKDNIEEILRGASMAEKTLIIAIMNRAYVEKDETTGKTMLDLFLEGFWFGEDTQELLNHLMVVTMDLKAYDLCTLRRLNCYKLETNGMDFTGEKTYMTDEFIKMMWKRTWFLLNVLRHGYNFIFTDMDILWLRNPIPTLIQNPYIDIELSTDRFNGDSRSKRNPINTGFYYIKSNHKTIALFNKLYAMRNISKGKKEQDVLWDLLNSDLIKTLGLEVRILDTRYFSGFCEESSDIEAVVTIHANCCKGMKPKLKDLLVVFHDWKRYLGNKTMGITRDFQWTQHDACYNSW